MNLSQAKETVAAYLCGRRRISRRELDEATTMLRADDHYSDRFRNFVGLSASWECVCRNTQARLAELAEMGTETMRRECPEYLAHLETCSSCKAAYWSLKPCWEKLEETPVARPARQWRKRFAATIKLWVGRAGALRESGIAPFGSTPMPVAATASWRSDVRAGPQEPLTPEGVRKEWLMADDETGCIISLALYFPTGSDQELVLECKIETSQKPEFAPRLEVRDCLTSRAVVSGPVSLFADDPVRLKMGSYLVIIESTGKTHWSWEVPIELVAEGDSEP